MTKKMTSTDYLKRPYARVVTPDEDGHVYVAQILEFPGCIAEGRSPKVAYERLERAATDWIDGVLKSGQQVPEPVFDRVRDYSGRVALRLPRNVHREAVRFAELGRISLNTFLVSSVSAAVGAMNLYESLSRRLEAQTMNTLKAVVKLTAGAGQPLFATPSTHTATNKTLSARTN